MITPTLEQVQKQVQEVTELSRTPNIVYFDDFINSISPLYHLSELPDEIRIAKGEKYLLEGDYEPAFVINIKDNRELLKYDTLKMWHNTNNKEFSLHGLGLIESNKSSPSQFTLFDTNPHCNIGGATGHGKSVLANDIIVAGSLVHGPWLVQFFLSDPKIIEFKGYATGDVLPHVNTVAATSDPAYAVSMLKYLIQVMEDRSTIFEKFNVKNIDAFNQTSGLVMPMLVLVLDELKAMLITAGKWKAEIDNLIQQFVAKARFCGGRCIMLSQGVVTELDPDTMKNINIRIALGCQPAESEKLVGNSGAAVNLGTMGKITFNNSAEKTLKQNVYLTSPLLPETPTPNSRSLQEIFKYQKTVWEKLAGVGARISPLSFFDQTEKLTKEQFRNEIKGKVTLDKIFLGEPAYINKSPIKMAHLSMLPNDRFSSNLGNNILILSADAKLRLNMISTLLMNFEELRKVEDIDVRVYSPVEDTTNMVKAEGYTVDGYSESSDVSGAFQRIVIQVYMKMLSVITDTRAFGNYTVPESKVFTEVIKETEKNYTGKLGVLMVKRCKILLEQLSDERSKMLLGFSGPPTMTGTKPNINEYTFFLASFINNYKMFDCEHKQLTVNNTPKDIRIFVNFEDLQGTEVKKNRLLELWMTIVKMGPLYGCYIIIVSGMLPTCGSELNGAFNKVIFFGPTNNAISQQKLADDYPDSTLPVLIIYADKTKIEDKCVKVKYATMLGD